METIAANSRSNSPQICADFVTQINAGKKAKSQEPRAESESRKLNAPFPCSKLYALCSKQREISVSKGSAGYSFYFHKGHFSNLRQ